MNHVDIRSALESGVVIYCESISERNDALDYIQSLGYALGFDNNNYKDDDRYHYIYLNKYGYIHMGSTPRIKKTSISISELLYDEHDLPDVSDLPDLNELVFLRIKSLD